eukprot:12887159-Prorocentrum_lima.AAC.1
MGTHLRIAPLSCRLASPASGTLQVRGSLFRAGQAKRAVGHAPAFRRRRFTVARQPPLSGLLRFVSKVTRAWLV